MNDPSGARASVRVEVEYVSRHRVALDIVRAQIPVRRNLEVGGDLVVRLVREVSSEYGVGTTAALQRRRRLALAERVFLSALHSHVREQSLRARGVVARVDVALVAFPEGGLPLLALVHPSPSGS